MPIGIGTATLIGAGIAGVGAVAAGAMSSSATTHAADTAAATEQANAAANNQLARDMHADAVARLDPYSNMGLAAGGEYMGLLGVSPPASGAASPWGPTTPAPTNALAPVVTPPATPWSGMVHLTGSSAAPSALHPVVAQQAQQAIAAGADPAAVAARAASMGVHL